MKTLVAAFLFWGSIYCFKSFSFSIVTSGAKPARKKISILNYLKLTNKPARAKVEIIKFPDFSQAFWVFKISLTVLQNSLTFH